MRRLTEQASRLWLIPAGAAYAGLLVLTRGFPSRWWDAGVFLSVAGRLLDGDRLYTDVLDNLEDRLGNPELNGQIEAYAIADRAAAAACAG
jgi:hypothetical protein